jgi:hypothetical protein
MDERGALVMTREEHDQRMAELDLPFEERRRLREQREKSREQPSEPRNLTDAEVARWNAYLESRLQQAIASEHELMIEVIGQALGEVSAQLREEIEKTITTKMAQASDQKLNAMLQASLGELKQEIGKLRGGLVGDVSDLPNPLARHLN